MYSSFPGIQEHNNNSKEQLICHFSMPEISSAQKKTSVVIFEESVMCQCFGKFSSQTSFNKTRSVIIVRVTMSVLSNAKRHNIFQWRPTVGEIRGRRIAPPPTTSPVRTLCGYRGIKSFKDIAYIAVHRYRQANLMLQRQAFYALASDCFVASPAHSRRLISLDTGNSCSIILAFVCFLIVCQGTGLPGAFIAATELGLGLNQMNRNQRIIPVKIFQYSMQLITMFLGKKKFESGLKEEMSNWY